MEKSDIDVAVAITDTEAKLIRKIGSLLDDGVRLQTPGRERIEDVRGLLVQPGSSVLKLALISRLGLPAMQVLCDEATEDSITPKILELAFETKADPSVVSTLLSKISKKYPIECFHLCCRFGIKGGFISRLAQENIEAVKVDKQYYSDEDDDLYRFPLIMAMEAGADESDIRTLIELWPASVGRTMYCGGTPLQLCYHFSYNKTLLDFMLAHLPAKVVDDDGRNSFHVNTDQWLCSRDLDWISRVAKTINGDMLLDDPFINWQGPGFDELLRILFLEENTITGLYIWFPELEKARRPEQLVQSVAQFRSMVTPTQLNTKIEELEIMFKDSLYCVVLDRLHSWPCLRSLNVDLGDNLEQCIPYFCLLLNQNRLKHLEVTTTSSLEPKKRKCKSERTETPLKPLYNALTHNSSLNRLELHIAGEWRIQDRLLLTEVLEKNTCLQSVPDVLDSFCMRSNWQIPLQYYLNLNRCGRKIAREESASLGEFVSRLGSIEAKLPSRDFRVFSTTSEIVSLDYETMLTGVRYGLLQEAVHKWAKL